jgi:acetyltransferase-like isoleucine patch superfamily enzyme
MTGWAPRPTGRARSLAGKVTARLRDRFTFVVLCGGDRVRYLRRAGSRIGRDCDIATDVANFGSEPWLVEIGDRVSVTSGVRLVTHDGSSRLFRDRIPGSSRYGNRFGTIRIHDDSFVGVGAILLPGVSVGPESIVAAGSVVTKSVPPRTVVAGVPARTVCDLDEYVERYRERMVPTTASDRATLRRDLTRALWGEER